MYERNVYIFPARASKSCNYFILLFNLVDIYEQFKMINILKLPN